LPFFKRRSYGQVEGGRVSSVDRDPILDEGYDQMVAGYRDADAKAISAAWDVTLEATLKRTQGRSPNERYTILVDAAETFAVERGIDSTPLIDGLDQYRPSDLAKYCPLWLREEFVKRYGDRVCYITEKGNKGKWVGFDGKRWRSDLTFIEGLATEMFRDLAVAAAMEGTGTPEAKATAKLGQTEVVETLALARSYPGIARRPAEFDSNPMLLGVKNGVLNLQNGMLIPHSKEYLVLMCAGVAFDDKAKCPRWERFIEEIFEVPGDPEDTKARVRYAQQILGYSLTGLTHAQCMFDLLGAGSNGKSLFVNTSMYVLGDYAAGTSIKTVTVSKHYSDGSAASSNLARMHGKRLVAAVEPKQEVRLDDGLIKQLTGGNDKVIARELYQDEFEFVPEMKIFLVTNNKPRIIDSSEGMWRRVRLINFHQSFPRNDKLEGELRAEAPGILNWMLAGWLDAQKNNPTLEPPQSVIEATAEYRREEDQVTAWRDGNTEDGDDEKTSVGALYESYEEFCRETGAEPDGKQVFGRKLESLGYRKIKLSGGVRAWQGLRLAKKPTVN
jgi:putative DNA primase/helicase